MRRIVAIAGACVLAFAVCAVGLRVAYVNEDRTLLDPQKNSEVIAAPYDGERDWLEAETVVLEGPVYDLADVPVEGEKPYGGLSVSFGPVSVMDVEEMDARFPEHYNADGYGEVRYILFDMAFANDSDHDIKFEVTRCKLESGLWNAVLSLEFFYLINGEDASFIIPAGGSKTVTMVHRMLASAVTEEQWDNAEGIDYHYAILAYPVKFVMDVRDGR